MTRFAEGKPIGTSKRFLARLDDERAMDLAGKVVSEGFVLAVSSTCRAGIVKYHLVKNLTVSSFEFNLALPVNKLSAQGCLRY